MDIKRLILVAIGIITLSMFYFPVTFSAFPVANSKNLMAAVGLVVAVVEFVRNRASGMNKDLLNISILAILVSLAGFYSVSYNGTPDYAYASYIVSFIIWSSSAYFALFVIKKVEGRLSVNIVINYLILLCVLQCVSVLLIDTYPVVKNWVLHTFNDFSDIERIERLYGIGPSLDVAGTRFASVLVMIAYMLTHEKILKNSKTISLYILAFLFILIVGSMVGRTTSVGGGIALIYLLWHNRDTLLSHQNRKFIGLFFLIVAVGISLSVYYYNNNMAFRENVRFAFEGFFNWWETGKWSTTSTNRWQTMFIWPESMKTWLIGDGYFDGPSDIDPYYTGPPNSGFYKWTDIGYLRFIFYFGIIGLLLFAAYFFKVAFTCMSRFKSSRMMFAILLLLNFIIWFKVSTDIFLVFALFLYISKEENDEYERLSAAKEQTL